MDANCIGWDDQLPNQFKDRWKLWRDELSDLENLHVNRCYLPQGLSMARRIELHSFSDARTKVIGQVTYIRTIDKQGTPHVLFVLGKAKVAPTAVTSIPRLELCAAVMATQAVQKITSELDVVVDQTYYYTDSKVVLGYIQNKSRRFYVYVANRVQQIHNVSKPQQWHYIATEINLVDIASRGISAKEISSSLWFQGPKFL
ncbi:uncharacterized protein LOC117114192 [Anneissia japonica]|uniref:uncharacterized protein LOC117114192 n=1 Tax=Anneissia japonica TaxID=1529436 RepID=UPI0014254D8D|nr:uncharacterized protein LOC117114192 [Anneissia japonica]